MCCVPASTRPGGKPVIELPGLRPTSPEMTDGPVLVTVLPASTAKVEAVPNPTPLPPAASAAGAPRATNPINRKLSAASAKTPGTTQRAGEECWRNERGDMTAPSCRRPAASPIEDDRRFQPRATRWRYSGETRASSQSKNLSGYGPL